MNRLLSKGRPQMKYFSIVLTFHEFQENAKSISIPYFVIADSRFPFWASISISEPWSPIQDENMSTSVVQSLPIFAIILVSFSGFMRMLSLFSTLIM